MKKRICRLLLAFLLVLVFCVSMAAAEQTGAQLYYVTDTAGLLSESEKMLLEKMAESVSQKYGVGVYIVTVEDYRDFHSEGVYKATYTIYHEYTMGEGPNRDGIMLLLSMDDRDWAMFCYGSHCEYAFNSYGQEKLEKVFLDNFGENDWYGGFEDYVKECRVYLEMAAGRAEAENSDWKGAAMKTTHKQVLALLLAVALLLLLCACAQIQQLKGSDSATLPETLAGQASETQAEDPTQHSEITES